MPAPPNDRKPAGVSPVDHAVNRTPRGGDVVIIGHNLEVSVLKAHRRKDGAGMAFAAVSVAEPNVGAVLRAAMATTAFGPGGDAPGDVDDDVRLTLLSQRPRVSHNCNVEMQRLVDALDTAVDDAVGNHRQNGALETAVHDAVDVARYPFPHVPRRVPLSLR